MRIVSGFVVAFAAFVIMACGGGSSGSGSSPTSPSGTPIQGSCTDAQNCQQHNNSIGVFFRMSPDSTDGTFSFTFGGQTFSGTGNKDIEFINLAQQQYEVSGQFSNTKGLTVTIVRVGGGSVTGGLIIGSLQSLEGPSVPTQTTCGVRYVSQSGTASFKFTFAIGGQDTQCS